VLLHGVDCDAAAPNEEGNDHPVIPGSPEVLDVIERNSVIGAQMRCTRRALSREISWELAEHGGAKK
jgi:hypothetical protein